MKFVVAFLVVLVSADNQYIDALIEDSNVFDTIEECEIYRKVKPDEILMAEFFKQWIDTTNGDVIPFPSTSPKCVEKDMENDFIPAFEEFYETQDVAV